MTKTYLVLGGARSGKTRFALALADKIVHAQKIPQKVYIATAEARDNEMRDRIHHHKTEREGQGWETIEEPLDLERVLTIKNSNQSVIIIDCLTLWLSNMLEARYDIRKSTTSLQILLAQTASHIILVSNEVGLGLVPMTELGRTFRDEQGRLNQALAQSVDQVDFMVAGLPMRVKG